VLLPDGKVFFVPYNSTKAAIYNPVTDSYTFTGSVYPGNAAYRSGTLTSDGRVCMLPFGASKIAYYDTRTSLTSFTASIGSAAFKYACATQLESGEIIGVPYIESSAAIINIGVQQGFSRAANTGIFHKR